MPEANRESRDGEHKVEEISEVARHGIGKQVRSCQDGQRACVFYHGKVDRDSEIEKRGLVSETGQTSECLPLARHSDRRRTA